MTIAFISQEAQNNGMTTQTDVASVLSYLQGRENYAVTGNNALAVYVPAEQKFKLPFEVVGDVSHPSVIPSRRSILFDDAVIREAQTMPVHYNEQDYSVRVAKPEDLVTIALVDNLRHGRDASILFEHFGADLNFEEIRNLMKGHPQYEDLYSQLARVYFELSH